jgi:hypothetical protein
MAPVSSSTDCQIVFVGVHRKQTSGFSIQKVCLKGQHKMPDVGGAAVSAMAAKGEVVAGKQRLDI